MQRIAVIGDISGLGRCSITAALPVISALGIECCPFPTAVLSAQTGYSSYHFIDLTSEFSHYENEWEKQGCEFDGILTGYIASAKQADLIAGFIKKFKTENTILIVDPVMGDDGKIYSTYTKDLCKKVSEIAACADIITPNLSELCILCGESYDEIILKSDDENYFDYINKMGFSLLNGNLKSVIVTGVRHKGKIYSILYENNAVHFACSEIYGGSYSGTGDLFASVISAMAVKGIPLSQAVDTANAFLSKSIESSFNEGTDRNAGVNFQKYLEMLKCEE